MNARYLVAPAGSTWEDAYGIAAVHGYDSNDFIGCRTFVASTGKLVIKMASDV